MAHWPESSGPERPGPFTSVQSIPTVPNGYLSSDRTEGNNSSRIIDFIILLDFINT